MSWKVQYSKKASKTKAKLPQNIVAVLLVLTKEIELGGPVRGNWPNYSKLGGSKHHCHIKDGRPTYVACWEVAEGKEVKLVEVYYVGTREKAPY